MLETKSLSKSYIKKQVLFDLNFTITGGHIYGLLGPNGSGKSTWMKICAGLVKPTSGSVSLEGRKIDIQTRNDIAYAPTENFFYPWMSIEEVGKYYQDFFPDFSLDTYHTLLEEMKLTPKQKLKTLSSGMNAKTKIAAALSRNAKRFAKTMPLLFPLILSKKWKALLTVPSLFATVIFLKFVTPRAFALEPINHSVTATAS